jgi:hypothetical protein
MHEVSTDAVNWVHAATYAELFAVVPVKLVAREMPVGPVLPQLGAPQHGSRQWYYDRAGTQTGPVEESALRQLIATGEVSPDTLVWNGEMPNWMVASAVPGLIPAVAISGRADTGPAATSAQDGIAKSLCQAALASRPWVIFLAVTAFVYAGLWALAGFLLLVAGAGSAAAPAVALGLFWIIGAVVVGAGGMLLVNYAGHLGRLDYSKSSRVLEGALERLKAFWVYVSIVLIVFLAFIVFFAIWIIAIGASVARWM